MADQACPQHCTHGTPTKHQTHEHAILTWNCLILGFFNPQKLPQQLCCAMVTRQAVKQRHTCGAQWCKCLCSHMSRAFSRLRPSTRCPPTGADSGSGCRTGMDAGSPPGTAIAMPMLPPPLPPLLPPLLLMAHSLWACSQVRDRWSTASDGFYCQSRSSHDEPQLRYRTDRAAIWAEGLLC